MYQKPYFMNYSYSPAFLANMADRLSDAICQQTEQLNKHIGSVTPVKSVSTMLYLLESGPVSLVELARALNFSHQLTSLRIKPLEKLGLVERKTDTLDKRRKVIELTELGRKDAEALRDVCNQVAKSMQEKFVALELDLIHEIERMIISLQTDPLYKPIY